MKRLRPAQQRVLPRLQALVRGFLLRRKLHRQHLPSFTSLFSSRLCTHLDPSSLSIHHSCIELYDPFSLETWRKQAIRGDIVVTEETFEHVDRHMDTLEDLHADDDKQYHIYDDLNRSRSKGKRDLSPYDTSVLLDFHRSNRRKSNRLVLDSPSSLQLRRFLHRSHSLSTAKEPEMRVDLRRKKARSRLTDSLTPSHRYTGLKRLSNKAGLRRREGRCIKKLLE